jgi:hypothetical protein
MALLKTQHRQASYFVEMASAMPCWWRVLACCFAALQILTVFQSLPSILSLSILLLIRRIVTVLIE